MKSLLKPKWILPLVIGVLLTGTLALSLLVGSPATRTQTAKAASADLVIVFEHVSAGCCKEIIVGTKKDPRGNYFVFHEPVFNTTDTHQVGYSNGTCFYTTTTFQACEWAVVLQRGQIDVQGPDDTTMSTATYAVTGGTGSFTGAKGWLEQRTLKNGTEYEDFFHLV